MRHEEAIDLIRELLNNEAVDRVRCYRSTNRGWIVRFIDVTSGRSYGGASAPVVLENIPKVTGPAAVDRRRFFRRKKS